MLRQFSSCFPWRHSIILYMLLFIVSCNPDKRKIDVSKVNLSISVVRLEDDLATSVNNLAFLKKKYGSFFDLFTYQLLKIGTPDTVLFKTRLNDFVHDADISNIYADTKKMYTDFSLINDQLTDAFRYFNYYFPHKIIPKVVTYVSGFSYAVVCADSSMGIGLDMYLGSDSKYYPSLQLPEYKIKRMRKEYIAADAMRGWAQSEWEQNASETDLLSQMIYQGKVQYFLDATLPDAADSIKFGYTKQQLDWCTASEKAIWSFLVDQKLLFATDASMTAKYVNDGPTTNGFPKESPGNVGAWIGFRIVKAYMEKYPDLPLDKLMNEIDYKKIFRDSNYKPAK